VEKAAKRFKALGKALAELTDMEAADESKETADAMGVAEEEDVDPG